MKRYYLSEFTGGAFDGDPIVPAIIKHFVAHTDADPTPIYEAAWIAGLATFNYLARHDKAAFAIVAIDAPDHAALIGDPRVIQLPDWSFDGTIGGLSNAARRRFDNACNRFGVMFNGTPASNLPNSTPWRDVFNMILAAHEPGVSIDLLDAKVRRA